VFCNMCEVSEELMDRADRWTTPILILFFVISGAELELSVFADWAVVVIGIVYIISRSVGKCFGANVSAKASKADPNIIKYLGITLLPQAGVALGMAIKAIELGPDGAIVRNITLFAVLVYELFGPLMTREALKAAGDIKPMPDEVKKRREKKLEDAKKHGKREHYRILRGHHKSDK